MKTTAENAKKTEANDTQRSRTSILFTPDTINRDQLPTTSTSSWPVESRGCKILGFNLL